MTGSSLVPIIIPIVAVTALFAWLALVFYAAAHPEWKRRGTSAEYGQAAGASQPGAPALPGQREAEAAGDASVPEGAPAQVGQERPATAPPRRAA